MFNDRSLEEGKKPIQLVWIQLSVLRIETINTRRKKQTEERKQPCVTEHSKLANLKGFLSCVNELVPFELGALDESLAALRADVHARSVGMQMLPHGRVVPEHLCAALEWESKETQCRVDKQTMGGSPRRRQYFIDARGGLCFLLYKCQ